MQTADIKNVSIVAFEHRSPFRKVKKEMNGDQCAI